MITYEWAAAQFLWIQHTGKVTGDELVRSALSLAGEERFDSTRFVLGDWLHFEKAYVNDTDVKTLIAMMRTICQICPRVKNATVIRPDESGNALMAFYKMLADDLPWEIEIFPDLESAYSWLDMSERIALKR